MADETDDIDLEQVIWDPRYRRRVIEQLNREAAKPALPPDAPAPEPDHTHSR